MKLPEELHDAIEALANGSAFKQLKSARTSISEDYRQGKSSHESFRKEEGLLSYLITRMPATFGACFSVFEEIRKRIPSFSPHTILDLGAGPGTATWAALESFPDIHHLNLVEREKEAIEIGKKLASTLPRWEKANWISCSLEKLDPIPKADLAILSYVLAEMADFSVIDRLWDSNIPIIVVVEPGTPKGFERVRAIREHVLNKGASLIAPCPHAEKCPMSGTDWCHFSARIERTKLHRLLKEGSLGYEDEKFSYVVFAHPTLKIEPIQGRIVRHPQKGSGHVRLSLCGDKGELKQITVSKKDKEIYRSARDAEWGDAWL